jgi:hypothetical protein
VQWDTDERSLAHFRTYARLHAALFPLLRALADEAAATGMPVCRPLALHHPHDPLAWAEEEAFLLGSGLLVAPVVARGAREKTLHVPRGSRFLDLWTGLPHEGGAVATVPAPLGRLPLLLADDALLPLLDAPVDTLDRRRPEHAASLRTLDEAERRLRIVLGPHFRGTRTLYDGTRLTYSLATSFPPLLEVAADPAALLPAELGAAWRLVGAFEGARGAVPLGDGAGWLEVESPRARRFTVLFAEPSSPAALCRTGSRSGAQAAVEAPGIRRAPDAP